MVQSLGAFYYKRNKDLAEETDIIKQFEEKQQHC